jgi:hypothetical protein
MEINSRVTASFQNTFNLRTLYRFLTTKEGVNLLQVNKEINTHTDYIEDDRLITFRDYKLEYVKIKSRIFTNIYIQNVNEITQLLSSVRQITVNTGKHCLDRIEIPLTVTEVRLGKEHSPFIVLHDNITHISFSHRYSSTLHLPSKLHSVHFSNSYVSQLIILPKSTKYASSECESPILLNDGLTHLSVNAWGVPLINFTNSITHLSLWGGYNYPTQLPSSLIYVRFGDLYNQPTVLPNSAKYVIFGHNYNQDTPLPPNIEYLQFGSHYNQATVLPEKVKYLCLGDDYNQDTPLPSFITHLGLSINYKSNTNLPESLIYLKCFNDSLPPINRLPSSLITIFIEYKYTIWHNDIDRISYMDSHIENFLEAQFKGERLYKYKGIKIYEKFLGEMSPECESTMKSDMINITREFSNKHFEISGNSNKKFPYWYINT